MKKRKILVVVLSTIIFAIIESNTICASENCNVKINSQAANVSIEMLFSSLATNTNSITAFDLGFKGDSKNISEALNSGEAEYNGALFTEFATTKKDKNNNYYSELILDKKYYIAVDQAVQPTHDIKIIGENLLDGEITILKSSNTSNTILIKANENNITIQNIKLTGSTANDSVLIDAEEGYIKKIGKANIINCEIKEENEKKTNYIIKAQISQDLDNQKRKNLVDNYYGIDEVNIVNCKFKQNYCIPFLIRDMPIKFKIDGCIVRNMYNRIAVIGLDRAELYTGILEDAEDAEELQEVLLKARKKVKLEVYNNNVSNNDENGQIIINKNVQYICFVWTKGGEVIADNNRIENIAVNNEFYIKKDELGNITTKEPVEVFDMYLLADKVTYTNNVAKNIYNFQYMQSQESKDRGKCEVASLMPNVKFYSYDKDSSKKEIVRNKFILEKEWIQNIISNSEEIDLQITDLNPVPIVNMYGSRVKDKNGEIVIRGDNIKITDNEIDSYFGVFTRKNYYRYEKNVEFSRNIIKIENLIKLNVLDSNGLDNIIFMVSSTGITNPEEYGKYDIKDNKFYIKNCPDGLTFIAGKSTEEAYVNANISNNEIHIDNYNSNIHFYKYVNGNAEYNSNKIYMDISENNDNKVIVEYSDEGIIKISGDGTMKNWTKEENVPWYGVKSNIKNVIIENGVTNIGNYAFSNCANLTNIVMSKNVVNIGIDAFNECVKLGNVKIPRSLENIESNAFKRIKGPIYYYRDNLAILNYKKSADNIEIFIEYKIGDINEDNKVNIADLLLIKRHILAGAKESWKLIGDKFQNADLNNDNTVNVTDLLLLKKIILLNR